jgi:transposase, IS5 family
MESSAMTDDFFRNRLDQMIDLRHPLAVLANRMPWQEIEVSLAQRWGETPTWQYFSGNEYFEHQWPCDPTQLGRFRKALGEEGVEELLARTMEVAITLKLIAKKELNRVIVDSTVQEKAIAYPTDSKLLEIARSKVVEVAKANGIELKQTYAKED